MKLIRLLLLMFTLLLTISATLVHAGVSFSGTHRLVSGTPADGGSTLRFMLTVTNTGDTDLAAARLSAKDPLVVPGSPGSTIDISGLAAGDSITLDIAVLSLLPPEQLREGVEIPLNFDVSATDASGRVASLILVSEGGTP
ncbi:hypothetical protein [Geobacter sp. DSM 9736]|uniref:hypothetical protein n=1 Tax=Geobacter sp. DSM 9736 TaxID=1277350 RepID=UPI000B603B46|nr:hypothetical protein [Geobacter sp. DSM 9736]SNB47924.1 hypothetical protein SAMN06269301_3418 [Geobacter sp. DSM 9736]